MPFIWLFQQTTSKNQNNSMDRFWGASKEELTHQDGLITTFSEANWFATLQHPHMFL